MRSGLLFRARFSTQTKAEDFDVPRQQGFLVKFPVAGSVGDTHMGVHALPTSYLPLTGVPEIRH